MATIYTCDRCKREFKERKALYQIEIQSLNAYEKNFTYDLCPDCLGELNSWLKLYKTGGLTNPSS